MGRTSRFRNHNLGSPIQIHRRSQTNHKSTLVRRNHMTSPCIHTRKHPITNNTQIIIRIISRRLKRFVIVDEAADYFPRGGFQEERFESGDVEYEGWVSEFAALAVGEFDCFEEAVGGDVEVGGVGHVIAGENV